jgi:WD40 repeat protein
MRQLVRAVAAATLLVAGLTVLSASAPRFWLVSTQAGFLKGEVEGLSIDSDGRLVMGPVVRQIYDASVPFIWTLATGPDGSVYSGSGNQGQVFRTDRRGVTSVFVDTPELEVHALAFAPDGQLYVGTSPDGKVYRVDKAGTSSVFFDPEDKYIWALAVDGKGRVYAATGEKGLVYRISPEGKGEVFYKAKSTHVTSLALDSDGRLLAGTESPGQVVRLDADGKAFVLFDSPFREIHALRVAPTGQIYAAAINGKPASEPGPAPPSAEPARSRPIPSVSTEITSVTVIDSPVSPGGDTRPGRRDDRAGAKGAVYRVNPDGSWDVIWESRDDIPYDVVPDGPGAVLIGTGNAGKVYRVSGEPARAMLLLRAGGQQVTAFSVGAGSERVLATSNPAKIYLLPGERSAQGTYTSEVKDAGTFATWGTLSWRASSDSPSRVQVFTRSGNTETPDEGWSNWSGPYQRAEGDAVHSPRARYLQWKAVLSRAEPGPALTSVTVGYLQRNLRPKVTSITVHPPGIVFQRPYSSGELEIAGFDASGDARLPAFSMPLASGSSTAGSGSALGRRIYQKGLQAFVWRAEDENDDRLVYDLLYRREGESSWRTLRRGMTDAVLVWDTTSVPDGTYLIRVVASDLPSNPASIALAGDAESASFEIDNTPPTISTTAFVRSGNQTRIQFEVRDSYSAIDTVEYSLDGGRWQPLYPLEGVGDAKTGRYELVIDGDATGRVVIKAVDAMDNAASTKAEPPPARK